VTGCEVCQYPTWDEGETLCPLCRLIARDITKPATQYGVYTSVAILRWEARHQRLHESTIRRLTAMYRPRR
jgi:hypothetical protein